MSIFGEMTPRFSHRDITLGAGLVEEENLRSRLLIDESQAIVMKLIGRGRVAEAIGSKAFQELSSRELAIIMVGIDEFNRMEKRKLGGSEALIYDKAKSLLSRRMDGAMELEKVRGVLSGKNPVSVIVQRGAMEKKGEGFLGLPWWVWIAGAVGIAGILVLTRKPKKRRRGLGWGEEDDASYWGEQESQRKRIEREEKEREKEREREAMREYDKNVERVVQDDDWRKKRGAEWGPLL